MLLPNLAFICAELPRLYSFASVFNTMFFQCYICEVTHTVAWFLRSQGRIWSHCVKMPTVTQPTVGGYLGCFQLLAAVSCARIVLVSIGDTFGEKQKQKTPKNIKTRFCPPKVEMATALVGTLLGAFWFFCSKARLVVVLLGPRLADQPAMPFPTGNGVLLMVKVSSLTQH